MYLMAGPTQYAPAPRTPSPGEWRRPHGRRALGSLAPPGAVQSGVATTVLKAAAADPEPISKAIIAVVGAFLKLFSFHGDPRDPLDSALVESGSASCYDIWLAVSGEALGGAGEPKSYKKTGTQQSFVNLATWSQRTSAYPNVPNGPLGDTTIDANQALAGCGEIIAQAQSGLADPGSDHYNKSLQNPFFTTGGLGQPGEIGPIPLLQKVLAAREAAVSEASTSMPSKSAASLLPIAVVGLLLYAYSAGE